VGTEWNLADTSGSETTYVRVPDVSRGSGKRSNCFSYIEAYDAAVGFGVVNVELPNTAKGVWKARQGFDVREIKRELLETARTAKDMVAVRRMFWWRCWSSGLSDLTTKESWVISSYIALYGGNNGAIWGIPFAA
jgi:hypothetical protein